MTFDKVDDVVTRDKGSLESISKPNVDFGAVIWLFDNSFSQEICLRVHIHGLDATSKEVCPVIIKDYVLRDRAVLNEAPFKCIVDSAIGTHRFLQNSGQFFFWHVLVLSPRQFLNVSGDDVKLILIKF